MLPQLKKFSRSSDSVSAVSHDDTSSSGSAGNSMGSAIKKSSSLILPNIRRPPYSSNASTPCDSEDGSRRDDIDNLESAASVQSATTATSKTDSDASSLARRKEAEQARQELTLQEELKKMQKEQRAKEKEMQRQKKLAGIPKKFAPYLHSLKYKEIKKALDRKKKAEENAMLSRFNADELNHLFEMQIKEEVAAKTIQSFFRRSRVILPWRRAVRNVQNVIRIQNMMRGYIARKWVARWHHRRIQYVTKWQGCIRKYLSNKHLRPVQAWEKDCATSIQRIIRGRLGRKKFRRWLSDLCATRIQCMWRGIVDRSKLDRKWLNTTVIPIQTAVRGMIARLKCRSISKELDAAAQIIQRRYRIWAAVNKIGDRLWKREMDNRSKVVDMLRREEEYLADVLVKLGNRLDKIGLKSKVEHATNNFLAACATIHRLENDTAETKRQREVLSPRAVQQGWGRDLEVSAHNMKLDLTKKKLDLIFNKNMALQALEFLMEHKVVEIEAVAMQRDQTSKWRDMEYVERRERNYWRDVVARRKAKRQAVADERRKWTVLWTTKNGKPDKRRRPGKAWDPKIFAGPEKGTYCSGGTVDLFAMNPTETTLKMGSKASVERSVSQLALQNYLDQVNHYDKLVTPLSDIMKDYVSGGVEQVEVKQPKVPGQKRRSQFGPNFDEKKFVNVHANTMPESKGAFGYGDVGMEAVPAMIGIGALEKPPPVVEYVPVHRRGPSQLLRDAQLKHRWGDTSNGTMSDYACGEGGEVMSSQKVREQAESVEARKLRDRLLKEDMERLMAMEAEEREREAEEAAKRRARAEVLAAERAAHLAARKARRQEKRDRIAREEEEARNELKSRTKRSGLGGNRVSNGRPGTIPWALLDELDAAKYALQNEKRFVEFHSKIQTKQGGQHFVARNTDISDVVAQAKGANGEDIEDGNSLDGSLQGSIDSDY